MPTPLPIRITIWIWLIAAFLVGHYGLLQKIPLPAVQGVLLGLTALILLVYFKTTALRAWISSLDLRALVALHVMRFVGLFSHPLQPR